MLNLIDLYQEAGKLSGSYANVVLATANDHVVRLARMTEPYPWHLHPNSDEIFLGLEGVLLLEFAESKVELKPGQMITVPAGVKHRTAPVGATSVNLTLERADLLTIQLEP